LGVGVHTRDALGAVAEVGFRNMLNFNIHSSMLNDEFLGLSVVDFEEVDAVCKG
jgi:hypothetical protein